MSCKVTAISLLSEFSKTQTFRDSGGELKHGGEGKSKLVDI